MRLSVISALAALASCAAAFKKTEFLLRGRLVPPIDPADHAMMKIVSLNDAMGSAFFDQLLDHNDPSKGTFKQKFWWNTEFWEGPGSPVS
jgi:hypothetical protein